MKLYTEEEIIRTFGFGLNEMTFKGFMNAIKPIELPTDEEIHEAGKGRRTVLPSFVYGAQWVRDKIQGKKPKP